MRTDVIDWVSGATTAVELVVVGVDVFARLQDDARVGRNGEDVDVRIVEKSLLVVGVVDVRRKLIERGLYRF